MKKGKLFVISGPSGAGKGTICKELLQADQQLRLSVSMTTRKPREGERDKVHYHFASHASFQALIEADGFLEYANVYGNYYGTPRQQVLDWMEQGDDVILEIDVQGALQVKKAYPESVLIFILPPSMDVLRSRIRGRGSETEEALAKRLGAVLQEITSIRRYDYSVVNDTLQDAVDRVGAIIKAEQCRLSDADADRLINEYKEDL